MDASNTTKRKNFRCVFNPYVNKDNRDGVVRSVIAQFEGYYADPEVTVHDDGFILSINTGQNLSATNIRDKILWNQFIDSVTAQDTIRKIQIIRIPKASKENEGSVGGFGPNGSNSGVDEVMIADGKSIPHMEYKLDMGDRPDGPPFTASLRYADPTGNLMPTIYGPGAEDGKPVDEDLKSDITDMKSEPTTTLDSGKSIDSRSMPKVFGKFRRIAIDSDTGGAFTLNQPNGFQSVNDPPDQGPLHERATPATGIGGGAPISGASWYVTQPGNEQGTAMGDERNSDKASAAPFGGIKAFKKIVHEPEVQDVDTANELSQAAGGSQSVPDGGQVEGWFANVRSSHKGEIAPGQSHLPHILEKHPRVIQEMYDRFLDYDDEGTTLDEFRQGLADHSIAPRHESAINLLEQEHELDHPREASNYFGLNETYDFIGDIDDYEF